MNNRKELRYEVTYVCSLETGTPGKKNSTLTFVILQIVVQISLSLFSFLRKMNIPAYTSPTLCIGRTFDAERSTAASDLFLSDIPTKKINVNKFSFKYTVVKNSKDVNDLFDVSGELSLKIKANLLKVEGTGQYINDTKKKEGTTTLLAVMKCTTVRCL